MIAALRVLGTLLVLSGMAGLLPSSQLGVPMLQTTVAHEWPSPPALSESVALDGVWRAELSDTSGAPQSEAYQWSEAETEGSASEEEAEAEWSAVEEEAEADWFEAEAS